jgi:thiosulfate dehydrogenase [quinone] large subunit
MSGMPSRNAPADAPSAGLRTPGHVDDPRLWKLLTSNAYYAILWMPLRFYVGRYWLSSGEHKLRDDAWMDGGSALQGFWTRAVEVPAEGNPAITYTWYRDFIQYMLDNGWYTWFAKFVAIGETLVGIALIVGAFAGIAAFFGIFMNFNYMLAGSSSANPILFLCGMLLILAWKVAGFWGLDRWLLPVFGAPLRAETVVATSPRVQRERVHA